MINSDELKKFKAKYPFLEKIIKEGYGKDYDLFEVTEENNAKRIEDCFAHGSHNSGGEFVSWDWGGIKNQQIVDLSAYSAIKESLENKSLDYVFCDSILTIEHDDHDYIDRSINIYEVKGDYIK